MYHKYTYKLYVYRLHKMLCKSRTVKIVRVLNNFEVSLHRPVRHTTDLTRL